jgi:hypothetical protein
MRSCIAELFQDRHAGRSLYNLVRSRPSSRFSRHSVQLSTIEIVTVTMLSAAQRRVMMRGEALSCSEEVIYPASRFTGQQHIKDHVSLSLPHYHRLRAPVHRSNAPHTFPILSQIDCSAWKLSERQSLHLHLHVCRS